MAKPRKNTEHRELAESLSTWGRKYKVNDDPYLVAFTEALSSNRDLAMWSTLNPLEYLPQPETDEGARIITYNHFLTIARNILVFVPVALTWDAVGHATSAFAVYVQANPNSVTNFLEFWQNGFGVLSQSWTIGHIAYLDFLLIGAVIALTMVTSFLGKRGQNIRAKALKIVDSERLSIGLSLAKFLFTKRAVTPTTLNQNVSTSIQNLNHAAKALEKITLSLEKSVKAFPSNKDVLAELKQVRTRLNLQ